MRMGVDEARTNLMRGKSKHVSEFEKRRNIKGNFPVEVLADHALACPSAKVSDLFLIKRRVGLFGSLVFAFE
ncbi:hypothetical protein D3C87_1686510 [compost metagenome]